MTEEKILKIIVDWFESQEDEYFRKNDYKTFWVIDGNFELEQLAKEIFKKL